MGNLTSDMMGAQTAPDTVAVIAAGGLGLRFGDPAGKQYVELCGLPVLDWSVAAFAEAPSIAQIVVVCPAGRIAETAAVVSQIEFDTPVTFVEGGDTRQQSCLAGIRAAGACSFIAIHDGARPLIEPATIEAAIARVREDEGLAGAICAHPSADTLKVVGSDGIVESTPDRSRYWAVQTPQVFRAEAVLAAHLAMLEEGFVGTDDASLVERAGGRVACVASPSDNMKVTVPEDKLPIEAILAARIGAGRVPACCIQGGAAC